MNVFTYGSLMFDQVWSRVVSGSYRRADAVLRGHERRAVRGETYPGVIAAAGASVTGVVYFDVDAPDLARLDDFEGAPYERRSVLLDLGGEELPAEVYLIRDHDRLEPAPWDVAGFERAGIFEFLTGYCAPRGI
jgi:gamma-glutamylcyclotransferase (GGCT)/AIG2-like uncharacterized protein YtfP